jgi:ABC-type Na+ efflux pump permease subunit
MMGKIVGIALIGLTQFVAWLILTLGITTCPAGLPAQTGDDPRPSKRLRQI